jgi:hypothetical protein
MQTTTFVVCFDYHFGADSFRSRDLWLGIGFIESVSVRFAGCHFRCDWHRHLAWFVAAFVLREKLTPSMIGKVSTLARTVPGHYNPTMSTLQEIEAATEALPPEQKRELFQFLAAKLQSDERDLPPSKPTDLSAFEGVLTLREEPMEYQSRARAEWP